MYAIVQTSGRQVKVTPGAVALVDGTAGEPGAELTLDQVLLVEKDGGEVVAGAPFVANARMVGVVDGEAHLLLLEGLESRRDEQLRHVGDRLIFMDGGRILEDANKDEFFGTPRSERAQVFLSKILQH